MKLKFQLFIFCTLTFALPFGIFAQEDNSLKFNTVDGVPVMDEELEFDTAGFMLDTIESGYFDKIDINVAPILVLYFKWMPGSGTDEVSNIAAVQYKHHTP
ncbi:MAG: hypothetical protein MJZ46_06985, partial [Bacteroidales bacterium]|nr:hypothetical protein [Bacteroidales bacterium]